MIKLIILDVDGCMSDGKIIYDANCIESKNFNVKDGFAIKAAQKLGYEIAIITGRDSSIVEHRAKELGIKYLFQGIKDKKSVAMGLCEELEIESSQIAAIGDDINDYKLLEWVGKSYTPRDGSHYLDVVAKRLERCGGDGCVREMIEDIFKIDGNEDKFLALWI